MEPAVILYRAVAYQRDTDQPEVVVFFEAGPEAGAGGAKLLRLLALAWGCEASAVEFYNLWSEPELVRNSTLPALAGDVRWLQRGLDGGRESFVTPDCSLLLVRPRTAERLQRAMERARLWHTVADARQELLRRTLPAANRMCRDIDRQQRRDEDRAVQALMRLSGRAG